MSSTVGRTSVNFGSEGAITAAGFPGGGGAGVAIDILSGTIEDASQIATIGNKSGQTMGKGMTERIWRLRLDIAVSADSAALAHAVHWPAALTTVTVSGAVDGSAEVNGTWNVEEGGGWTFDSQDFRKGNINLVRYSGADFTTANATPLAAMS